MIKGCCMLFFGGNIVKFADPTMKAVLYRFGKTSDPGLTGETVFPGSGNP